MKLSDLLVNPVEFRPVALAEFNQLSSAVERILNHWPNVVAVPPERDRERLVEAMRQRLENNAWLGTKMSDVTSAAVALYDEERRNRCNLANLRTFYCEEIACSNHATFLSAMFAVYIGSYVPAATHTNDLANALEKAKTRIGGHWSSLLEHIPECLDHRDAHTAIAGRMTRMAAPWDELRSLGLRSPHASGLMDYVHLSFVARMSSELHERAAMKRFFGWLKPEGQEVRESGAAEAICALLAPWQYKSPSADDELYLTEQLILLYGDPRIRSESAAWAAVPDDIRAIIERWLTGENIRFFLDVVSAVEESHMWAPRRKFWLGLHDQNRIDAAWVAFSEGGAQYARSKGADNKFLRFGRQVARGTRAKTSLLILKIGNKIVVEGSHDYKVHVFRGNHPNAPKLYEHSYDCEGIRLIAGSWSVSHNGDWQGRVLEQI